MAEAPPASLEDQGADVQRVVAAVTAKFKLADKLHKPLTRHWEEKYGLYRNYNKIQRDIRDSRGTRDRGGVVLDAKRAWNADLHIPLAYATIETIIPRLISNPPQMYVRPLKESAADAADRISKALEKQQNDIDHELILQMIGRSGCLYGLGAGKTYWDDSSYNGRMNVPVKGLVDRVKFRSGLKSVKVKNQGYTGPCVEDVDIFDFFWEPTAKSVKTSEWFIHRTWRSFDYVAKMVKKGQQTEGKEGWTNLDLERVKSLGGPGRDASWSDRMMAAGFDRTQITNGDIHEVWEFHDRQQVITILDRVLVVRHIANPFYHGDVPFQIFRPTIVNGEFCGIGEVEPIAHLIYELDTLRGQRRDNATMKLQPPTFYQQGLLQKEDVVYGPGVFVPVLGDPREAIFPLPVGDIPGSGYQEEEVIKADVDKATGISDAVAGGSVADTSQATATGIQLVQAAANVRIALKTRNLIKETALYQLRQMLWLNRQNQLSDYNVRVDNPDGSWAFETVTQADWNKEVELIPDLKSTEPDNPPQRRNDAITLLEGLAPFAQQGVVDPKWLVEHTLTEFGIADATQALAPPQSQTTQGFDPQVIGAAIQQAGVPQQQQDAILQYIQQAMSQQQQPPTDGGPPQPPAANGAAPPQYQPQGA